MQVKCKTTGKDMNSWLLKKWEKEYQDKQIEKLMTKDLSHEEFDKELDKIIKKQKLSQEK